jgi:hypothetical protein
MYVLDDAVFVKQFARDPQANYPDGGCNCEMFTNQSMLEVETLGPLATLSPGQSVEHKENWAIFQGAGGFDLTSDDGIAALMVHLNANL